MIGTATDPYQPAEGHYRLTRRAIETLGAARTPISLITRGPMIVRDVDVLTGAAERADVGVTFSIPTLDREIWRLTEPGTAPPAQRLRALRTLVEAGIDASVGMAPILPGLSDDPAKMADVVRAARDAGATSVWTNVLYLRPGTREHFLEALARDWPELLPRYERLYAGRAYVARDVLEPVRERVRSLAREQGIADRRRRPIQPPAEPEQLALAGFLVPDALRTDHVAAGRRQPDGVARPSFGARRPRRDPGLPATPSRTGRRRGPPRAAARPIPVFVNAVRLARRADDDVPLLDDQRSVADPEGGLAGFDDEDLGVRVPVELRAGARLRVDEDDRERDVTVLGADELVGMLGVLEVVEPDDVASGSGIRSPRRSGRGDRPGSAASRRGP